MKKPKLPSDLQTAETSLDVNNSGQLELTC